MDAVTPIDLLITWPCAQAQATLQVMGISWAGPGNEVALFYSKHVYSTQT